MAEERERTDAGRHHLAWLAHPVTLAAVVVLVVNDHLLKDAYPGLVTGKLSDVAGLVLAPAVLASLVTLLVPRAPAGPVAVGATAVVGLAFAIVKALPAAAAVASDLWSMVAGPSVVHADLTDLLALPALGLAWWAWTRARGRPAPGAVTRAVRLAVVLPVALASVAATSAAEPSVRYAVGVGPGVGDQAAALVARIDDAYGRDYAIVGVSPDGRSWEPPGEAVPQLSTQQLDAIVDAARAAQRSVCLDEDRCWRVMPGDIAVEETTDGGVTWTTAWSLSGPKRERARQALAERVREVPGYAVDDLDREMACTSVAVVPPSGSVVAACGLTGFVCRDPDGRWRMLGFDGTGLDISTSFDSFQRLAIVLCGVLILLIGAEAHALRFGQGSRYGIRQALAIIIAFLCLSCLVRPTADADTSFVFLSPALMFLALVGVLTLAWAGVYLGGQRSFPWWTLPPAVLGPAAALIIHLLMLRGHIPATPAWIATWSVLAGALVAALALSLLVRGPDRVASR